MAPPEATTEQPTAADAASAARAPGRVAGLLNEAGELTIFALRALRTMPQAVRYTSEVLHQASVLIRGTTPLMLAMNAFMGMSVVNFGFFFLRTIGASDYTGLATGYVDIRQGLPTMFGWVFTANVCCAIAAQLGAMKVSEEIDAYESTGVDSHAYVVGTRLLAVLLFLPIGVVAAAVGQTFGSFFAAVVVLQGLSPSGFLDVHWSVQSIFDQTYALVGCAAIAIPTMIVACFYGLRSSGGPAGVGSFVARSLVVNLVLVHVIAAAVFVLAYGTNIRLPIGG